MSYEDDYEEYEEYDDYDEEPDPETQYYYEQYKKIVSGFSEKYSQLPLQQRSTNMISQVMKELQKLPYEPESLRKSFAEDAIQNIKSQDVRNKLLKELFLSSFNGLSLEKEPIEILKVLCKKETTYLAELSNKYGDYSYILKLILVVVDRVEPTLKKSAQSRSRSTDRYSQADDNDYEYSDVLYWEAVHDGDIMPDDDAPYSGYNDFDDHYYDNDYYYDDSKKFNSLEDIANSLEPYIALLENKSANHIPSVIKKPFLIRFKPYVYKAESILKDIEVKEHFSKVLPELQKAGASFGLTVKVSESFETSVHFFKSNGNHYIEFTLFNPIDDKEDWSGNSLSLYIEDIENNCTDQDLSIALRILQIIGYKIGDEYKELAKKALKSDGLDTVQLRLPSGLKVEIINHYNELRQFLRWKDI
jgi:hypothetical protein